MHVQKDSRMQHGRDAKERTYTHKVFREKQENTHKESSKNTKYETIQERLSMKVSIFFGQEYISMKNPTILFSGKSVYYAEKNPFRGSP